MRKCRLVMCVFCIFVMFQANTAGNEDYSGDEENAHQETTVKEIRPLRKPQSRETLHSLFPLSDDNKNADPYSKSTMIQQAADELRSILNKRTVSQKVKSMVLSRIFDAQGDPKKASIANDIFRKALEPAQPTHGAVGDLGAEMIKVSVLTKPSQKLLNRLMLHSPGWQKNHDVGHHRTDKHSNFSNQPIQHQNKSKMEESNTHRPHDRKIYNTSKLTARQYRLRLQFIHKKLEKMLETKRRLYRHKLASANNRTLQNSTIETYRNKNDSLNFEGKTAKLLSIRVHPRRGQTHQYNLTSKHQTGYRERKDYVIELDDSNNIEDMDDPGERRHLDGVISLLRGMSLPNNRDVEYVDDNEDDDDDGFITPQRRQIGRNLFFNSFPEEEEDEDEPETEEQSYQRTLEHFEQPEEELLEPRLEENIENYADEENFFSNRPSINPYGGGESPDGRAVVMEYDKRKRSVS